MQVCRRVKSSRPMWQLDPQDNSTLVTTRPNKNRPTSQLDPRDNSTLVTTRRMKNCLLWQLDPIYHYLFILCNFITFYTCKLITNYKQFFSYPCPQYNYPPPFGPSPIHSIPLPPFYFHPIFPSTSHPCTPPISSSTHFPYSSFFPATNH